MTSLRYQSRLPGRPVTRRVSLITSTKVLEQYVHYYATKHHMKQCQPEILHRHQGNEHMNHLHGQGNFAFPHDLGRSCRGISHTRRPRPGSKRSLRLISFHGILQTMKTLISIISATMKKRKRSVVQRRGGELCRN